MSKCFLLLCLLSAQLLQAQERDRSAEYRAVMAQSEVIFEGQVLQTTASYAVAQSRMHCTSEVQILHVFRGSVRPDTVQVVYKGPLMLARSVRVDPLTGTVTGFGVEHTGHGPGVGGMHPLPQQMTILFFCRPLAATDEAPPAAGRTQNPTRLEPVGLAFYEYGETGPIRSDVGGEFPHKQALFHYLSSTYQLSLAPAERDR